MRITLSIRGKTPEFIKFPYRLSRDLIRDVFFTFLNYLNARKYRNLIVDRFPDFGTSANSGVVIDLGANVGHFSQACRMLGFSVIAVEPHPVAVIQLRKRFRGDPKVRIISSAIGNTNGSQTLHLHADHSKDPIQTSISASTIPDKFFDDHQIVNVESIDIKDVLADQRKIQILKCDIEGAEHFIIPDIIIHAGKIERLLLETHVRFMSKTKDAENYNKRLSELNEFISTNYLESKWLTDWV
jgi:FkbM family methyltransferase